MTLNRPKTKHMSFNNCAFHFPISYLPNNRAIDLGPTYEYLGIPLQPDLSWHYHAQHTPASANRSFSFLTRALNIHLLTFANLSSLHQYVLKMNMHHPFAIRIKYTA